MIGGIQNRPIVSQDWSNGSIYFSPFKSNLEEFKKKHQEVCPKVSLFNLMLDPQENENLADKYPELVLELLAEAENAVKDATPELVGKLSCCKQNIIIYHINRYFAPQRFTSRTSKWDLVGDNICEGNHAYGSYSIWSIS